MKKIFFVLVAYCLLPIVNCFSQGVWTQKANFSGTARWGSSSFSIGTKGYLVGGYDGTTNFSDLWEYDPAANSWAQKAAIPQGRRAACAFAINSKGYVCLGAHTTNSPTLTDIWEYDPISNSWNAKANFPSSARYGAASFAIGNKGYVCCGNEGTSAGPYTNELWEFDPASNTWNAKANFIGNARYGITHSCFVIGTKGYVGLGGTQSTSFSDFFCYDQATNAWSTIANYPGSGQSYASGFGICYKGFICAGKAGSTPYADCWQYDATSNAWTQQTNFTGGGRWIMTGCVINGRMYLGTGYDFVNNYKDWWEYACSEEGINELQNQIHVSVFPNPSSGIVKMKCEKEISSVEILNVLGKKVFVTANNQHLTSCEIDLRKQPKGIYFYLLTTAKGEKATGKLIIE